MFIFAGIPWAIWIRKKNLMAIEKKFPDNPTDVMYIAISILQKWCQLLKENDKSKVNEVNNKILQWLKDFTPATLNSDICELYVFLQ